MAQLFSVILSLSVSGGLVGLLVLAFRPVAGRYFAKRWTYYLWLLVIVRLLVPVHGELNLMEYLSENLAAAGSHLSEIGGMAEQAEEDGRAGAALKDLEGAAESADGAEVTDMTLREDVGTATNVESGTEPTADAEKVEKEPGQDRAESLTESGRAGSELHETAGMAGAVSASGMTGGTADSIGKWILQIATVIWLIGVIFTALRKLWIYCRFVKGVCAACAPVSDQRILAQYAEINRRLGVQKIMPLYESAVIESPMLIGLFNPCIYLPSGFLKEMTGKENDIILILHHELVHYKRRDLWYKWVFQAALCVHWFNPLLYVFQHKFNIDCELASCTE